MTERQKTLHKECFFPMLLLVNQPYIWSYKQKERYTDKETNKYIHTQRKGLK